MENVKNTRKLCTLSIWGGVEGGTFYKSISINIAKMNIFLKPIENNIGITKHVFYLVWSNVLTIVST